MSRFMGDWLVAFIECRGCQFAAGPLLQAPLGLVDNAWDLESEDCGLESRMGVHWRSDAPNMGWPVLISLIQLSKLDSAQKQNDFDLKHSGCTVWKNGPHPSPRRKLSGESFRSAVWGFPSFAMNHKICVHKNDMAPMV